MAKTIHALDFLQAEAAADCPADLGDGLFVLFGDELFLRRLALQRIRDWTLGGDDVPHTTFDGREVEWRDVADEVDTRSLFGSGGRRLVVVDDADEWVSEHRDRLEQLAARSNPRGLLVLQVGSWPATTRLYKALDKSRRQVDCRAPLKSGGKSVDETRVRKWLASWSKSRHQATLEPLAAELLLELAGPHFGLLDQQLAKLALFAGLKGKITAEMVRDIIGGWRARSIWETIDAAVDGRCAEALRELHHLLQAGEAPHALFGQIAWSLRRFGVAVRYFERAERAGRPIDLSRAVELAGFRKWPAGELERGAQRLRKLGRARAGRIFRWVLETDLALKGSHAAPDRARLALEQLVIQLAS